MNRLEGNVALITGGSRGIGAAVALRLAEEGADLVLTYENNAERAGEVVEQIKARGRRALAVQADSAVPEALTAAVDEAAATFGRLDILVNNAGVFLVGPLEDLGSAEIDRTLAVNVRAPLAASQAVTHASSCGPHGTESTCGPYSQGSTASALVRATTEDRPRTRSASAGAALRSDVGHRMDGKCQRGDSSAARSA
ncbi:SDR family NAD(P)-dependent oxidoreductase [Streptomyces mirabilis]|uniref:SDR family NAD(P)-dependent oxidoreductase n=1 Tax=Streptomyces mirabilis TaxID=68239 RepID=UPI00362A6B62